MNQFPNQTNARGTRAGIRHGRHPRHPHRLHGFSRSGHPGRGRNRRAVHELHKALAEVARTGDEQLRGEAAQIVTEAAARLNGLLAADR
jgi:hypothetical protein